jgi:hypothetical protein
MDAGAGGAGPGGGSLGILVPGPAFIFGFTCAPGGGFILFELVPFMVRSLTAPFCFEVVRAQGKQDVKNPMFFSYCGTVYDCVGYASLQSGNVKEFWLLDPDFNQEDHGVDVDHKLKPQVTSQN